MSNRRALLLVSIAISVAISVLAALLWDSGTPSTGAPTPWESVGGFGDPGTSLVMLQPGPDSLAGCIKWSWFADEHPSTVIVYFRNRPDTPADEIHANLNVDIVGEFEGTWHGISWWAGNLGAPANDEPIALSVSRIPSSSITHRYGVHGDFMLAVGQTDNPAIAVVELRFESGEIVRQAVTQGVFAVVRPATTGLCGIRTISSEGAVLVDALAAIYPSIPAELRGDACSQVQHLQLRTNQVA